MDNVRGKIWLFARNGRQLPSFADEYPKADVPRGEMPPAQRISYTNAVWCLMKKPPQLRTEDYPGVRNRFDDFVA